MLSPENPLLRPAWPERFLRPGSDLSIPLSNLPTLALICSNIAMTSVAFHNQGWRLTLARHGVLEDGNRKRWWKRKRRRCCRSSSLGAVKGKALAAAATLSGCHVTSSSQAQLARAHSLHSSWTEREKKLTVSQCAGASRGEGAGLSFSRASQTQFQCR